MKIVSVIVPVFQSEPYLEQCISSITNQDWTDLQILLIDDGSQDRSPLICDLWEKKDSRIQVVHTKNLGASHARNIGLDLARGSYVSFVDSDDWIESSMISSLVNVMEEDAADIVVCGREVTTDNNIKTYSVKNKSVYDNETAMRLLVEDKQVNNYLWDKLYRKDVIKDIRFPYGDRYQVFNDVVSTYRIFKNAKKVVQIPEVLYHYRRYEGSLQGKIIQSRKYVKGLPLLQERFEDLEVSYPMIINELAEHYLVFLNKLERNWVREPFENIDIFADNINKEILPFVREKREALIAARPSEYESHWMFVNDPISYYYGGQKSQSIYLKQINDKERALKNKERQLKEKEQELKKIQIEHTKQIERQKALIQKQEIRFDAEKKRLNKRLNDIQNGWSWKIGRFLTWLPRQIRKLIK